MTEAHSKGTKKVYSSGVNRYRQFNLFIGANNHPEIPASHRFLLYLVYLSQVCRLKHTTVRVYASAVRNWFIQRGKEDPIMSNGLVNPQVRLLMRGIRRDQAVRAERVRHPLILTKLKKVVQTISLLDISFSEKIRLRAAMLLAFWGFLRSAEYCTSGNGDTYLRNKDIRIWSSKDGAGYLEIYLVRSKSSQFKPVKIYIHGNKSKFCAVKAIRLYNKLAVRRYRDPEGPFFGITGSQLTSYGFNILLKQAVHRAGMDSKLYSAHSLRAGAATTAANTGVPPFLIQKLGRWKSESFKLYIKEPKLAIKKAQRAMLYGV